MNMANKTAEVEEGETAVSEKPPKIASVRTVAVGADFLKIAADSYSAMEIMQNKIKRPFEFEGELYICIGSISSGVDGYSQVSAVRVVPADGHEGKPITYQKAFRNAPGWEGLGYYGIKVSHKGDDYVMAYPKVVFVPDPIAQHLDHIDTTKTAEVEDMLTATTDPRLDYLQSTIQVIDQMRIDCDLPTDADLFGKLASVAVALSAAARVLE